MTIFSPSSRLGTPLKSCRHWWHTALCGLTMLGGVGWAGMAQAAELIEVRYQSTVVTVSIDELRDFAATGSIPPSIDELLRDGDKLPNEVQDLLTEELRISPRLVDRTVNSSTGDFFLMKLDEAIDGSVAEDDVEAIRATLIESFEDDSRLSLLELLERYPADNIKINLTELEGAYNTAVRVVRDIQPALDVAKDFLQDIICDCEPSSNAGGTGIEVADHSVNCQPELLRAETTDELEAIAAPEPTAESPDAEAIALDPNAVLEAHQ